MKHLQLIWKNITRKKTRMFLTLASFAVALFLFGLLFTIHNALYEGVKMAGVDRLLSRNKTSINMALPYAYKEKIRQISGVKAVMACCWFGGIYQEPRNFFPQFVLESDQLRRMYPKYAIPDDQWKAYVHDRQGCLVGRKLMERFGWKLGDRIALEGTMWPGTWEFNIRAIFENTLQEDDTGVMFFQYKYFDGRSPIRGMVAWFMVQVNNSGRARQVAEAIDKRFKNSSYETVTETEQVFQTSFVNRLGNINLILMTIGAVVVFTLLLVTASSMAMAIRERKREIGVLKTLGYSDLLVLVLVLLESIFYSLVGGGVGLILAKLFTLGGDPTDGMLRIFYLSPLNMIIGLLIVLIIGLASGITPALHAMHLNIVGALRRV